MFIFFLLGFIFYFVTSLFLFYFSHYSSRHRKIRRIYFLFLLLAISYAVLALFYFLWITEFTFFGTFDFTLINSIILLFRIIIFLFLFSFMFDTDNYLLYILFYSILFSSYLFSFPFDILLLLISFVILLFVSVSLYTKKGFERIGLAGIGYSFVASILFLFVYLGYFSIIYAIFILDFFLIIFILEICYVLRYSKDLFLKKRIFKEESSFIINFLKYFIFIVVLVNFIFIATVSLHELGHFGIATFIDCSASQIIYEGGLPHTEVLCQSNDSFNYMIAILGGIFLPVVISIFLFFTGGRFVHELGLLVLGFNLLISYRDILDLGFSDTVSLFFTIVGLITVLVAIALLISSRVEERQFLRFTQGHKDFYMQENT